MQAEKGQDDKSEKYSLRKELKRKRGKNTFKPLSKWKRLIGGRSSHVLVHVYIYAATRTYTYIHTFILSPYFIRIMLNQDDLSMYYVTHGWHIIA